MQQKQLTHPRNGKNDYDGEYCTPAAVDTKDAAGAITKEKALEIALKQAGVSKESVTFSQVHRDFDDDREIFDVDANTGAVVDFDTDYNGFDMFDD